MRFKFTILNLFVVTTLVGLAVALDVYGPISIALLLIFVPTLILGACLRLVFRLQMVTAKRLAPFFYSRGMLSVLRWTCGKGFSAWALCQHAARLSASGQYDSAIAAYTRVLALYDSSAGYWAHRGVANYGAGNLAAAESDLTMSLELDPSLTVARAYRGYARLSLGKCRDAVDDLDRISCEGTDDARTALARGHAHELLGEWEHAVHDYALAYNLSSMETAAGILLARLQACCPDQGIRDGAKAVENAHRMCVRTEWKDWEAVSVLAAAHAEAGDFEAAVLFAEKAFDLAPAPEKAERQRRLEQFKVGVPFRLSQTDRLARMLTKIDATQ